MLKRLRRGREAYRSAKAAEYATRGTMQAVEGAAIVMDLDDGGQLADAMADPAARADVLTGLRTALSFSQTNADLLQQAIAKLEGLEK